jgi:hypothetical protein
MLRALLGRSLPTPPVLCCRASTAAGGGYSRQTKKARVGSSTSLWVSYMDVATVRKRLVSVAQEVRFQLEKDGMEPLPDIRIPQEGRVRHGFWFMAVEREALKLSAAQSLRDRAFATECGSLSGPLHVDDGSKPNHLRLMLLLDGSHIRGVEDWVRTTFGAHGEIVSVATPTLQCNWDPGYCFVTFAEPLHAEAAVSALDGAPGCVPGCNMFVDFAEVKDTARYTFPTGPASESASEQEPPPAR